VGSNGPENAQAAVKKVLIAEQKKATNNQSAMIYDQYIQNLKKLAGTRKS
tara:strand:+ start:376 stop:525 length:150 start_codon:yes stop_codon:yes gene_type:complete